MKSYDNILLVEIKDPTKLDEMEKYLLEKYYPRIKTLYKVGRIITVKFKNISEEELMEKLEKEREGGVIGVTKYKPI